MNEKETVLVDLGRMANAAAGLLEDTVLPMFQCMTLEGILQEITKKEKCSKEEAAMYWMTDNYDSLSSALYAVEAMVAILQP